MLMASKKAKFMAMLSMSKTGVLPKVAANPNSKVKVKTVKATTKIQVPKKVATKKAKKLSDKEIVKIITGNVTKGKASK